MGFFTAHGTPLDHVKPPGAFFGMAASDGKLMRLSVRSEGSLVSPCTGLQERPTSRPLRPAEWRSFPGSTSTSTAAKTDTQSVERRLKKRCSDSVRTRTMQALSEGTVTSVEGTVVPVTVQSICVHTDLAAAPAVAKNWNE
ncbi:LamB/YcsF family protein [Arthrobacter sp. UYEF36]|uniref:LamB/YcsF family protein n=1 Tax=Arthrobacter sp. UYEF36 TaxID=1756366 RepID=UPI003398C643